MSLKGEVINVANGIPPHRSFGPRKNNPLRDVIRDLQTLPSEQGYRIVVPEEEDFAKTLNKLRASIGNGRLPYRPTTRSDRESRTIEIYRETNSDWAVDGNNHRITTSDGKLLTVGDTLSE